MAQGIIFGQATGGGPSVKNIQHGSITLTGTTGTATIDAVVTANSAIIWGNYNNSFTSPGNANDTASYLTLTNTTTVTATRTDSPGTLILKFCVVEYESGILASNQVGSIALSSVASNTDTITSVDTSKSMILYLGTIATSISEIDADDFFVNVELTNGTTVTASRAGAGGTITAHYQVIEFN